MRSKTVRPFNHLDSHLIRVVPADHLIHCSIGGHKSLLYSFNRAIIGAGMVGGKVYVAELPVEGEGKKVVGAAAWFGPGEALLAS